MEEFRFLYTTKFKGKRFCVLSNANYSVYILEILNGGKLCYPQYDDYISFYKRYQGFTEGKIRLELKGNDGFTNDSANLENILRPGKKRTFFRLIPKVIKDGVLILAIAAVLTGCAFPSIGNASWEMTYEDRIEQHIDLARELGDEVEYIPEIDRCVTRSYVDEEGEKIILCTTNDQMKPYFPDKNQNPTYEDVRNTIRQNENIPEKFKIQYIEALERMEKQMPEVDLFVLNLNAERMSVKEKKYLGNSLGNFDPETAEINYLEDVGKLTIVHELIHALLGGEFEIGDGSIIKKTFRIPENQRAYDSQEHSEYFYTFLHGVMVEEYVADELAKMLTGEKKENTSPYAPTDYHIEMFRTACDYSMQDLINDGPIGFAIAMIENDINNPIAFMDDEDHLISRYNIFDFDEEFSKYGVTISSIPVEFFVDWAEEKFDREEERISERAIEFITGTSFTEGVYYVYGDGDGGTRTVDSVMPEQLAELVQSELIELDKSKITSIKDFIDDMKER